MTQLSLPFFRLLRKFQRNESGIAIQEYALFMGLVVLVAVPTMETMNTKTKTDYNRQVTGLNSVNVPTTASSQAPLAPGTSPSYAPDAGTLNQSGLL